MMLILSAKKEKEIVHLTPNGGIFPTVKSSKSMPRLRSSFCLEELSMLFYVVQSCATGLRSLCSSATN